MPPRRRHSPWEQRSFLFGLSALFGITVRNVVISLAFELSDGKSLDMRLDVLRFLGESTDDYLFLWEFERNYIHFFGPVNRRFNLALTEDNLCTVADWSAIVYEKDRPLLLEDLTQVRLGKKLEHNMEYRLLDRNGNRVWISCRGRSQLDDAGRPVMMIGRLSDAALSQKVDPLTNALNAVKLPEDLTDALSARQPGFLLLVGVDNLKTINIRHGRETGNRILCLVAECLEEEAANRRRVYRLNGDCFAAILSQVDKAEAERIYNRVGERLSMYCTLSAGVAAYHGRPGEDANIICQYAEAALDRAKRLGKNNLAFFSQADYEQRLSTIELQEELQSSVRQNFQGFHLCYQPQIRSRTYGIFGAEALLRYTSPSRGEVSPSEFIPILEQSGLICPVGLWVLEQALAQCRVWRGQLPQLHISVNISYAQLSQESIAQSVLDALAHSGLPGEALTLEVTESMQLQDYPIFNKIFYQWKTAGIGISVDDFGTGYSSLGYLKSLEIDEIKIDRCFVSGIQHSAYNYRLLSNMVELARQAQIRVCCEGVENQEELAVLEKLRPDLLQGFLFGRPCPPEEFARTFLDQSKPDRIAGELRLASLESVPLPREVPEENPGAIIEALDEIVYVSDLATYELYYLNPAGQRITGAHDYKGRKCYKVLQGLDEPCSFCTNGCLKKDSFYFWEWSNKLLGRHFMLKDKLIQWRGRPARLEIAIDVTEREVVSQRVREKLDYAQSVLSSAKVLAEEEDMDRAVQRLLAQVGDFYQADRAYLFQPSLRQAGAWNNTYEWCRPGVSSELDSLQELPAPLLARWMGLFREDRSVIILDLEDIRDSEPDEWDTLHRQNIRRLIAVPVKHGGRLVAFLGVDNPRHCIGDDALIRMLTLFVANRFHHNETEERLGELLSLRYQDILKATQLGLWFIRIDRGTGRYEMFADETMRSVLGLERELSPEDCYRHWYSRISEGYYQYVNQSVDQMISSDKVVQLEYTWVHPTMGEVMVRCVGVRAEHRDTAVCLEGYHRILNVMETPRFLTDAPRSEVFEFNERRGTIYFHTQRQLLAGDAIHQEDFPRCWLEEEMVHPHFAEKFCSLFSHVDLQEEQEGLELMLKSKSGDYQWFKLKTRRLGQDSQDRHTILVLLDEAGQERVTELALMRMREFYKASLSETIAYVEVDLESGFIEASGGLWADCRRRYHRGEESLFQFMKRNSEHEMRLDEEGQRFFQAPDWKSIFSDGSQARRVRYQRLVDGEWHWVELVARAFREQVTENLFALLYLKDIDTQVRREQAQRAAAQRDPLTQVYNRNAFQAEVERYMSAAQDRQGTLLLLDIDNFKSVNDCHGHLVGDEALKRVTSLLHEAFRSQDLMGRLGGDEFMVFLKGSISRQSLDRRMDQFLSSLGEDSVLPLTCSAGIARADSRGFSFRDLLNRADVALYQSKEQGKGHYCYDRDGSL